MVKRNLIDLDMVVYEACFAGQARLRYEKKEAEEEYDPSEAPPFGYAVTSAHRILEGIAEDLECDNHLGFLSGTSNFRYDLFPEYKANRKSSPHHKDKLKQHLRMVMPCLSWEGLEADDLIGLFYEDGDIIVSRDKDLRIIPGLHYGWETWNSGAFGPTEFDTLGRIWLDKKRKLRGGGLKFFYSQLITGDSADDIDGIKGMGDVFAHNLLSGLSSEAELRDAVLEVYQSEYGDDAEDTMLLRGRLLWMTQEVDENLQPVLWSLTYDEDKERRKLDGGSLQVFRDQCLEKCLTKMGAEEYRKDQSSCE